MQWQIVLLDMKCIMKLCQRKFIGGHSFRISFSLDYNKPNQSWALMVSATFLNRHFQRQKCSQIGQVAVKPREFTAVDWKVLEVLIFGIMINQEPLLQVTWGHMASSNPSFCVMCLASISTIHACWGIIILFFVSICYLDWFNKEHDWSIAE